MNVKDDIKKRYNLSSPEHAECEHFEEMNSKIHNEILLLVQANHIWTQAEAIRINWYHTRPIKTKVINWDQ